ncbi:MAG: excinuclease ABC subunit UvrC [Candidatus Helarchaeota archaeon]
MEIIRAEILRAQIAELPDATGVYFLKDGENKILYIGKAKSLRKRVKQHLVPAAAEADLESLGRKIEKIEYILTDSEIEALLLEADLIKKYQPLFNIRVKDDKSFPYILITEEEYPRVIIRRIRNKEEFRKYRRVFGPFTNMRAIKKTINYLIKLFPVCSCAKRPKKPARPCYKYDLKRCPAPCCMDVNKEEYIQNIVNIELFLMGKKKELIEDFKQRMAEAAETLEFELAAKMRDSIWALEKTIINQRVLESQDGEQDVSLRIRELQDALNLPTPPQRIEAFDISNLSGTNPTGSMVLFVNGNPIKSGYRRFKIKTVGGINDAAMMREVIERRYRRVIQENLEHPDLIVVDGGKPQLNIAYDTIRKLKLEIPIIGLAKRFEHIFVPGKSDPIILSSDSPALFLLQRVRDEAHRFALKYHQLLRKKRTINRKSRTKKD